MQKTKLIKINKLAFLNDKKVNRIPIFNNRLLKIGQAAKLLGVSIDSLRRWELSGKLIPVKTPGKPDTILPHNLKTLVPVLSTLKPLIPMLGLSKFASLTFSLILIIMVASTAIMTVYSAIQSNHQYLSSSTIKPTVTLASNAKLDNSNLNQSAKILKIEPSDLIEETNPNSLNDSTINMVNDSWTLTSEDCINGVIERGI